MFGVYIKKIKKYSTVQYLTVQYRLLYRDLHSPLWIRGRSLIMEYLFPNQLLHLLIQAKY